MRQKIMFGLQVFTTLILFMTIFVSYLVRGTVKASEPVQTHEISNQEIGSSESVNGLLKTFTVSLPGVISCGK